MLDNIKYVYGIDNEENRVLLGANISYAQEGKIYKQEIYVGVRFTLEDILENQVNARALGITDIARFEKRYNAVNASGIVYFPQTETYSFLEEGDMVLPWESEESILPKIEEAVARYKHSLDDELNKRLEEIAELDPEDPLIELYGLKLSRTQCSNR